MVLANETFVPNIVWMADTTLYPDRLRYHVEELEKRCDSIGCREDYQERISNHVSS